jgi:hypothetical protein
MQRHRRTGEISVLGYRIERVEDCDEQGRVALWYEVLAPDSGAVLGSFADRVQAERHVVGLELSTMHRRAAAMRMQNRPRAPGQAVAGLAATD